MKQKPFRIIRCYAELVRAFEQRFGRRPQSHAEIEEWIKKEVWVIEL